MKRSPTPPQPWRIAPTPWKACAEDYRLIEDADGLVIADIRSFPVDTAKADSDLIAAAPDLLRALERILNRLPYTAMAVADYDALNVEEAREICRKARGE